MSTGNKDVDSAYANASRAHAPSVKYPSLNLDVFIVGNCFLSGAVQLFAKADCRAAPSIKEADLVVFLGGADIDPQLYGEKALGCTHFNPTQDQAEIDAFTEALHAGVPSFGICRGMQFLHAMSGGKLYQDVRNHTGTHNIVDVETGAIIRASSMHHQMCIEDDNTFALAYAETPGHGRTYLTYSKEMTDPQHRDLEAAIYSNIDSIGVQGHPEVGGYPEYSAWCLTKIDEFLDRRDGGAHKAYIIGNGKAKIDPSILPQSITTPITS